MRAPTALVLPGLAWLVVFMLVPCGLILVYAFLERGTYGGIDWLFTFDNFVRGVEPLYVSILIDSALIAGSATAVALLLGYPAAWGIARAAPRWQTRLLVLVMLPFWSNYLIRTYAWIVLLNREGLISRGLVDLGVIDAPVSLLYTAPSVVVGLVYNYLPFVILSIYASLQRLDPSVLEASEDLGAPPWRTFVRVVLPLTMPGVAAGAVFVFVLSIGNFITPDLLGGGRVVMVGNLIYDQFLSARDWPFGAALSLALIAIMMGLLFAQAVATNRGR